jgi:hypothetical protein
LKALIARFMSDTVVDHLIKALRACLEGRVFSRIQDPGSRLSAIHLIAKRGKQQYTRALESRGL